MQLKLIKQHNRFQLPSIFDLSRSIEILKNCKIKTSFVVVVVAIYKEFINHSLLSSFGNPLKQKQVFFQQNP